MPRRLGDDPLARRRKSPTNRPQTAVADGIGFSVPASAGNPVDFPGQTPSPEVPNAESGFAVPVEPATNNNQATSYNDVFFHRREEESALAGGGQTTVPQAAEDLQAPPAATEAVPEIRDREYGSISVVEPASTEEAVHTPEPAVQSVPNPASLEAAATVETAEQQPEAPKKGFFKKIFSAFKKP